MRLLPSRKRLFGLQLILSLIPIYFCVVSSLYAMDITLQWAPSDEPGLAGYKVFYRQDGQSYNYSQPYWECTDPQCTIYDLDTTKTYYFVVRAFDNEGNTSGNSNEVALEAGMAVNTPDNGAASVGAGGGGGGGCFIATAASGSLLEPHVRIFRQFRDRFMLTNGPGEILVKYYYKYSPRAAHFITKHAVLRALVCVFLLPLVVLSWILLNIGPGVILLIMLLLGMGMVYMVRWRNNAISVR
jgi:hypothetical protein